MADFAALHQYFRSTIHVVQACSETEQWSTKYGVQKKLRSKITSVQYEVQFWATDLLL